MCLGWGRGRCQGQGQGVKVGGGVKVGRSWSGEGVKVGGEVLGVGVRGRSSLVGGRLEI